MEPRTATTWGVHRETHKAVRHALFGVTTQAGATDPDEDDAVKALVAEWVDVRVVLLGHHAREREVYDPFIRRHAAHVRQELDEDHQLADSTIARLNPPPGGSTRWRAATGGPCCARSTSTSLTSWACAWTICAWRRTS